MKCTREFRSSSCPKYLIYTSVAHVFFVSRWNLLKNSGLSTDKTCLSSVDPMGHLSIPKQVTTQSLPHVEVDHLSKVMGHSSTPGITGVSGERVSQTDDTSVIPRTLLRTVTIIGLYKHADRRALAQSLQNRCPMLLKLSNKIIIHVCFDH